MNLIIKTKNIILDESLRKLIENKLGRLKKFLKGFRKDRNMLFDTFVDVERETGHHKKGDIFKTEVKIVMLGKNIVAKAHGESLLKTITDTKEGLEQEIRKYKEKTIEMPRRKYRKVKKLLNR